MRLRAARGQPGGCMHPYRETRDVPVAPATPVAIRSARRIVLLTCLDTICRECINK